MPTLSRDTGSKRTIQTLRHPPLFSKPPTFFRLRDRSQSFFDSPLNPVLGDCLTVEFSAARYFRLFLFLSFEQRNSFFPVSGPRCCAGLFDRDGSLPSGKIADFIELRGRFRG
jgi:hypothetical protein